MKKTSRENKNVNANGSKYSNDEIYDLFIAEFEQLEKLREKIVSWDLPSESFSYFKR